MFGLTDASGVTTFAYDKIKRQIRKTIPSNEQLRYGYDRNRKLTSYSDSGGTVTYGYDQVNRLTSLASYQKNGVRQPNRQQPLVPSYWPAA